MQKFVDEEQPPAAISTTQQRSSSQTKADEDVPRGTQESQWSSPVADNLGISMAFGYLGGMRSEDREETQMNWQQWRLAIPIKQSGQKGGVLHG